jgi:mRNA interferase MazF
VVADLRQGDIWWANLPLPVGRRPVLILTRTDALAHLANVTVVPLTRTIRGIEAEAVISPADGVPELSAANLDNVITIAKNRLDRTITSVSDATLADVKRAIGYVFALTEAHAG